MLVFFGRYIILAKHHFAIFFFGFFVLECIIFYLSFSWLVFLFLSLSFCNSALFSFNSMYHFATQLWFLSKRFKRYLWANGRCYITSACPSPSTNRAHERGQYKAASFWAAMTRMYAPILTPRTPAWRAGRMGDPAAPSPTETIKHILKINLRTSSRACGALGRRGRIWSSGGGVRVGRFRKCL